MIFRARYNETQNFFFFKKMNVSHRSSFVPPRVDKLYGSLPLLNIKKKSIKFFKYIERIYDHKIQTRIPQTNDFRLIYILQNNNWTLEYLFLEMDTK